MNPRRKRALEMACEIARMMEPRLQDPLAISAWTISTGDAETWRVLLNTALTPPWCTIDVSFPDSYLDDPEWRRSLLQDALSKEPPEEWALAYVRANPFEALLPSHWP